MNVDRETTRLSASEVLGTHADSNEVSGYLKVYDVILAGVEAKSN